MRQLRKLVLVFAAAMSVSWAASAAEPKLKIAVLKFGTVNWLMETVRSNGLDRDNGFELVTIPLAGKAATSIAFKSGEVDLIVSDWVWALRERANGVDTRFAPYSRALGALITRGDVADICALKGRPVGVVGGEQDKSWIVLQAFASSRCGFDLALETQALFGAPPLMSRQLEIGAVDAVSTFWPFAARLEAAGMSRLAGITETMAALGIDPPPPLVGFVWSAERIDPAVLGGFLESVATANRMLREDDAAWERLRPLMRAADAAEFAALRDAYRQGIPEAWSEADTASARRLYELLLTGSGEAFAIRAGPFDAALFRTPQTRGDDDQ